MLPIQQSALFYITNRSDIMTTYTIYQHIFPNNKQYIGITKREPETRWGPGGYHYKNNPPMWEAIQEFGWDNIQHIILESDVSEEEVSRKERQYIDQYDSANPEKGYNRQRGGLSGESSYYDEDQIIELYEDGWTLAAIAKQVGCCARTASDVLHKYGIPDAELVQRSHEAIKGTGKLMDDWDTFYDLFQNQNKSLVEISKITGWSYGSVARAFKEKNINVKRSYRLYPEIPATESEQIRQYILEGKTRTDISLIYHCQVFHISNFIHNYLEDMYEQVFQNRFNAIAEKQEKPICQYTLDKQYIKTFSSVSAAEKAMLEETGHKGHTRDVLQGRRNQACGYFWGYENKEEQAKVAKTVEKRQQAKAEQGLRLEEVLQKYKNLPMCAQYKEAIIRECKEFLRNAHSDTDFGLPYIVKCAKQLGWQYKRIYLTSVRIEKYNLPQELLHKEYKYFYKD